MHTVAGAPHVCWARGTWGFAHRFRIHRGWAAAQTCNRMRDLAGNSAATGPKSTMHSMPSSPPTVSSPLAASTRSNPSHKLVDLVGMRADSALGRIDEPIGPVTTQSRPTKSIEGDELAAWRRKDTWPASSKREGSGSEVKTSTSSRRSMAHCSWAPMLSGLNEGPPRAGVGDAGS